MTDNEQTKSFVMYESFFEAAEQMQMDYEAIGKYVMMLRAYAIKGQELKCEDGRVNALLTLTKPLITASTNRYKKAVKGGEHGWKGGEHGIKGGRPRLGETKEDAYERRRKERELKVLELNQEPIPAVETPENPKNPLNDNVNDYEKLKENGYAKDYVDEKDNEGVQEKDFGKEKDFMSSLILDDDFDGDEEYHFYEEGSASAYMERLRLQEEEKTVRSFLEEQEDM